MVGQTLIWGVKWSRSLKNFLAKESWWNKKSNETRIKWFGIIIKEIFYFQNQQKFGLKLGKIKEHDDLKHKINDLKLIKTQIPVK